MFKTQISKIIQSGRLSGLLLSEVAPLGITVAASALDAEIQK